MIVKTATQARKELFSLIEEVNEDRAPIHITSRRGDAVLVSVDDYAAWQETAYLFASPANARHLLESMAQSEAGLATPHELISPS